MISRRDVSERARQVPLAIAPLVHSSRRITRLGEARRRKLASTEPEDKASRKKKDSIGDFFSRVRQQAEKTGRLSALEIVHHIEATDLLIALSPNSDDFAILKGEDRLEEIVDTGQAEKMDLTALLVSNDTECDMIAAVVELVARDEMGPKQVETFQTMLDDARRLT